MTARPGLYAVLLGSGISTSAGIPTGYEITQSLIRRLAQSEGQRPVDPLAWYRERYNDDPGYSHLLESLANTPAERQALLRPFFEPNEEEREQGLKIPTAAHKALAALMQRDLVRTVITTNFDRLLEHALQEKGVEPIVLASDAAIAGAEPLVHLRNVVIKINGDYLDASIRNTVGELSDYPEATLERLRNIFTDYGLLICGWSAEWDLALRLALEGAIGRRYSTFWTTRSQPSEYVVGLIAARSAISVPHLNADAVFTKLDERCMALERDGFFDEVTPHLAAATAKRWLQQGNRPIDIHDMIFQGVDRLGSRYQGDYSEASPEPSKQAINARLDSMEASTAVLMHIAAVVGAWGSEPAVDSIVAAVRELCRRSGSHEIGQHYTTWIALARYPPALVWYCAALGAFANRNSRTLKALFSSTIPLFNSEVQAARWLSAPSILGTVQDEIIGYERYRFGSSRRVLDALRPIMSRELSVSDCKSLFFQFEYVEAVVLSADDKALQLSNEGLCWPVIARDLTDALEREGNNWIGVTAGLFESSDSARDAIVHLEGIANDAKKLGFHREPEDLRWSVP